VGDALAHHSLAIIDFDVRSLQPIVLSEGRIRRFIIAV